MSRDDSGQLGGTWDDFGRLRETRGDLGQLRRQNCRLRAELSDAHRENACPEPASSLLLCDHLHRREHEGSGRVGGDERTRRRLMEQSLALRTSALTDALNLAVRELAASRFTVQRQQQQLARLKLELALHTKAPFRDVVWPEPPTAGRVPPPGEGGRGAARPSPLATVQLGDTGRSLSLSSPDRAATQTETRTDGPPLRTTEPKFTSSPRDSCSDDDDADDDGDDDGDDADSEQDKRPGGAMRSRLAVTGEAWRTLQTKIDSLQSLVDALRSSNREMAEAVRWRRPAPPRR